MLKGKIKEYTTCVAVGASALLSILCSCEGKNGDKTAAQELLTQAQEALAVEDADKAIALLDSLDTTYPAEVEILRQSMALRPMAVESKSRIELQNVADSIVMYNSKLDSLAKMMENISVPGTDGYFVPRASKNSSFLSTTAVSPRVDPIGQFYLVSSVNPAGSLHHTSITVTTSNGEATSATVSYDGELNSRMLNSELITFSPSQCDEIKSLIMSAPENETSISITFNGESGRKKAIKTGISPYRTAIEYSQAINEARRLTIEQQRLNARIEAAAAQAAAASENVKMQK